MIGEDCLPETDPARLFVHCFPVMQQAHSDGVKVRGVNIPELNIRKIAEDDALSRKIIYRFDAGKGGCGRGRRNGGIKATVTLRGKRLVCLGDNCISIEQFGLQVDSAVQRIACEKAINLERRLRTENVFRAREEVVEVECGNDAQGDLTVDASEGHVINLVPEGRNVIALGRVDLHDKDVLVVVLQMLCEFEGEGGEPAFILT